MTLPCLKAEKIGGVMRYGIPDFRLPESSSGPLPETDGESWYTYPSECDNRRSPSQWILCSGTVMRGGVYRYRRLEAEDSWCKKAKSLGNVYFAIDYLVNPDVYELGRQRCRDRSRKCGYGCRKNSHPERSPQGCCLERGLRSRQQVKEKWNTFGRQVEFVYGMQVQGNT